jgi:DNA-directed RNA polymerase specialized sigma24 family protein
MQPAVPACSTAAVVRLTRLAGSGDHAALDALARRTRPMLEEHARRALARHWRSGLDLGDAAEEVVAEVEAFLVAGAGDGPGWRRFEAARARGELDAWLYGIVRNKVRRRLRDARRRESFLGPASREIAALGGHVPALPDRALDAARALRLAGELPPRERAALALWLEDAPSREIAAQLRFASPHAVDCCLARGKQRLRHMMLDAEVKAA